jgi:hypothetical protein
MVPGQSFCPGTSRGLRYLFGTDIERNVGYASHGKPILNRNSPQTATSPSRRKLIVVCILLAGLGGFCWAILTSLLQSGGTSNGRRGGQPVPVEIAAGEKGPIAQARVFSGTLEARSRVTRQIQEETCANEKERFDVGSSTSGTCDLWKNKSIYVKMQFDSLSCLFYCGSIC